MIVLYEHSEKRLSDKMRFEAQIHGVEMKGGPSRPQETNVKGKCIPGDPESYSHLSMEKREELTRKMMGRHKLWAQKSTALGEKIKRTG